MEKDSGEKERKKENELIINLINKARILSISFFDQDIPTIKAFLEIARREAGPRGFSRTAIKALAEYTQRHEEGNPQLKIASYLPTTRKSPMAVLCWSNLAGATSDGKVYCRLGGKGWIQGIMCYSCRNNQLRKKDKA